MKKNLNSEESTLFIIYYTLSAGDPRIRHILFFSPHFCRNSSHACAEILFVSSSCTGDASTDYSCSLGRQQFVFQHPFICRCSFSSSAGCLSQFANWFIMLSSLDQAGGRRKYSGGRNAGCRGSNEGLETYSLDGKFDLGYFHPQLLWLLGGLWLLLASGLLWQPAQSIFWAKEWNGGGYNCSVRFFLRG